MKQITGAQYWTEKNQIAKRRTLDNNTDQTVLDIINQIKQSGDAAIRQLTKELDDVLLPKFQVTKEEFKDAYKQVSPAFFRALTKAKNNIQQFHAKQMQQSWFTNSHSGILLGQKITPLEKVGIYVPGGKAAYPSTVLMNVIPAKIAGVESIHIATPPQANGKVNPHILVAAKEAGVDSIYKIGGAQAIAAFAYGTETVPKVQKITGPGNAFVASAKKCVYGDVAIDMIAGPSEICIVADESAPAPYIAADLLSQAEHDEAAKPICITADRTLAAAIQLEVEKQTELLSRKHIIKQALKQNGRIILVKHLNEAFTIVNDLAPEHVQLMIKEPMENLRYVNNAGAIFIGNYSPEALGDYLAGPNHTLPTNGTAAFSSPLGVYDFVKKSSIIHYDKTALLETADEIIELAMTEKLTAHAESINLRKDGRNAKSYN
ncbi:histidinol dehydrogenase [Virgibacillus salarius]|uniref:histidinol dehydrogenase n=1 Tax=Virgibacillus salarius TaxID=447199 RepID=UPI0031DA5B96